MNTQKTPGAGGLTMLPADTVLERYRICSSIAAGGFGITYLCRHTALGKTFALKEHFPRQFAYRDGGSVDVRTTDPDTFSWALERFLQEGRALASCSHPNVVSVADVFEANGTAYMVLGYEVGRSLKTWLDELGRPPAQAELDAMLGPLLDALAYVHDQGLLHRDIAPDNIIIRPDGSPCLIDFGAARQAVAEKSELMSAVVKSGYSPPEQYTRSGRAQGPWTDIYSLAATVYRALTGTVPQEAPERQVGDEIRPVSERIADASQYRPEFLSAIDQALVLKPRERPQSVREWRSRLLPDSAPVAVVPIPAPPPPATVIVPPAPRRAALKRWSRQTAAIPAGLAAAVMTLGGIWWASTSSASLFGATHRHVEGNTAIVLARATPAEDASRAGEKSDAGKPPSGSERRPAGAEGESPRQPERQADTMEGPSRSSASDVIPADARIENPVDESEEAGLPAPGHSPARPGPGTLAGPELARATQSELKRVGCYAGWADGEWGELSKASLARFLRIVHRPAASEPSMEVLEELRRQKSAVCLPLLVQPRPATAVVQPPRATAPPRAISQERASKPQAKVSSIDTGVQACKGWNPNGTTCLRRGRVCTYYWSTGWSCK